MKFWDIILNPKIGAGVMIALDVVIVAGWAARGDWRKTIYWVAATVITWVVTY